MIIFWTVLYQVLFKIIQLKNGSFELILRTAIRMKRKWRNVYPYLHITIICITPSTGLQYSVDIFTTLTERLLLFLFYDSIISFMILFFILSIWNNILRIQLCFIFPYNYKRGLENPSLGLFCYRLSVLPTSDSKTASHDALNSMTNSASHSSLYVLLDHGYSRIMPLNTVVKTFVLYPISSSPTLYFRTIKRF